MKRKALGKGLDALLPQTNLQASSLIYLDVVDLQPNPRQPRTNFEPESLRELADSVKEKGILQPLVIRRTEAGYEIIAGERRWRAAQKAGLLRVPAIVQNVSDAEMLEIALVENIQRDDLGPIEEALAYQLMMQEFRLTQEQVATRVGRSRAAVANLLRLLQLPAQIQGWVTASKLSMGHARALLPLPENLQLQLARLTISRDLSVREVERRAKQLSKPSSKAPGTRKKDPNIQAAESRLEEHWQTKVEIRQKGHSGQIVFHFHSQEELDRLYETLLDEN